MLSHIIPFCAGACCGTCRGAGMRKSGVFQRILHGIGKNPESEQEASGERKAQHI